MKTISFLILACLASSQLVAQASFSVVNISGPHNIGKIHGRVASGDLNNDGRNDVILCGFYSGWNGNTLDPTANNTNSTFEPIVSGEYKVIATVGTCEIESNCLMVEVQEDNLSIETVSTGVVKVCPNPSEGIFQVDLSKLKGESLLTIKDLSGRIVIAQTIVDSLIVDVHLNELTGLYLLVIENEIGTFTQSVVVQ